MKPIDRIIQWNALAGRYAFSQLRPRNLGIAIGIYGCTVIVMAMVLSVVGSLPWRETRFDFKAFYGGLLVLQVILLWGLCMYLSSSIVSDEIAEKSIDFFRLLPVTPHERIIGLLVGRNLLLLLLGLINGVLVFFSGLLGGVSIFTLAQTGLLIVAGSCALMLAGLLSSVAQVKKRSRLGSIGFVVVCVYLLPDLFWFVGPWASLVPSEMQRSFYGFSVPLLPLASAVIIYFAVWFYVGLVRRFLNERSPLFSPSGAVGFMVGFVFLLIGFIWPQFENRHDSAYLDLWMFLIHILVLPLLLLAFASSRSYDQLAESVAAHDPAPRVWSMNSNLAPSTVNLLIWISAAGFSLPLNQGFTVWNVLAMASFWIVLLLLIEAILMSEPLTDYFKRLGAFLALMYIILPPLLAGLMKEDALAWFSPIGHFGMLRAQTWIQASPVGVYGVLPFNLFLASLLGLWITARYKSLGNHLVSRDGVPGESNQPSEATS